MKKTYQNAVNYLLDFLTPPLSENVVIRGQVLNQTTGMTMNILKLIRVLQLIQELFCPGELSGISITRLLREVNQPLCTEIDQITLTL